ncbi:hypothetical protein ACEWY4_007627 [Coilia grayii]|uniref:Uncharacterized protein n=1 Tax=Coilia grayii TaxID=363190 RepID=A0ABD1KH41_9TELE
MEKQQALCTCLLLLGVLVNIQCSGSSPVNNSDNSTTAKPRMDNTTLNIVPTHATVSNEFNPVHTDYSTISPSTTMASSSLSNTSPHSDEHSTTRGIQFSTTTLSGTTKTTHKLATTAVTPSQLSKSNKAGYVVLVIIIIVAVILVIVCCLKQNKRRRYSVDLRNKHEDAVIPLSTVEADAVFDTTPEKEMETFTAQESSVQETSPELPAPAAEAVVESEPDKGESVSGGEKNTEVENSGSQDPLTPEKSEKMELVDLNDGEPTASTKTSMESLEDQLNDNNSNNYRMRANGSAIIASDEEVVSAN